MQAPVFHSQLRESKGILFDGQQQDQAHCMGTANKAA